MRNHFAIVLFVSVAATAAGAAEPAGTLTGTYALGGTTLVDPPPGEDPRSHYRVFLTGAAAKDLYDALRAAAEDDECLGDGSQVKRNGGISCTHLAEDDSYECSFAVGVDGGSVAPASSC
jgi:hypothetical protein